MFGSQEANLNRAAQSLKVMAHPARLKILCALRMGEQTVQNLEFYTGLLQTTLSQHLGQLRNRGIVDCRREANYSIYRFADERMVELFELVKDIYCGPGQ
jgi:ArsR family transcriptional regulator